MNCSTVQLLDLPDEMLIEIFNKLTRVDVLYSILGVNKQLDRLARDPIFTHFLDLTTISDAMLDRFCSYILPQIHHNIQSLLVEPSSIARILLACDYPQLHKIILNSIKPEVFINYLSDDSSIVHIFKQITHLEVFTTEYYRTRSDMNLNTNAYARLFSVCQRLTHLNINAKCFYSLSLIQGYALPLTMCSSSIIVELNINVNTTDDCLRLLDGRFNRMKTFTVTINYIDAPSLNINNQSNLPNLTTFFLASDSPTEEYDNVVVPLLRRMSNIEKLTLVLDVENRPDFIDGAHLYKEILIYMPRITKFMFNITTTDDFVDLKYWLTSNDIEDRYVIKDGHPYVYCCIEYFTNGVGRYRISTLPLDESPSFCL